MKHVRLPRIGGHEGTGIVVALGPNVTSRRIGDRVGLGPMYSTCLQCEFCLQGEHQLCPKHVTTGINVDGTFCVCWAFLSYSEGRMFILANIS